eukprot:jgi/Tetstr1/432399/TSEL_021796.t1
MADLAPPGKRSSGSAVKAHLNAKASTGASRREGKEAHGGVVDGTASRVVKTLTDDKKRKRPVKKRRGKKLTVAESEAESEAQAEAEAEAEAEAARSSKRRVPRARKNKNKQ